jgi:hypothetical protein
MAFTPDPPTVEDTPWIAHIFEPWIGERSAILQRVVGPIAWCRARAVCGIDGDPLPPS